MRRRVLPYPPPKPLPPDIARFCKRCERETAVCGERDGQVWWRVAWPLGDGSSCTRAQVLAAHDDAQRAGFEDAAMQWIGGHVLWLRPYIDGE